MVVQRRHRPRVLTLQLEPLSARHEELRPVGLAKAGNVGRNVRQQVLCVVDQQQRPLRGERVDERLLERGARGTPARRAPSRPRRARGPGRAAERARPTRRRRGRRRQPGRRLQGQPGLARPAGARRRQQPDILAPQQADDLVKLWLTAEKRCRRDGKVRLVQRPQAREIGVAQLEEALRRREVLEAVLGRGRERSRR